MATNKGSNSVVSSNSLPLSERTQCQYSMWAKFRRMLFRRRSLRAKLFIGLVFLLLVSILFFFPFFFAPPQRFSTSNNLNFGRSASSSPLQNPPFAELLTAGIAPKRIHSHNDCELDFFKFYMVWLTICRPKSYAVIRGVESRHSQR